MSHYEDILASVTSHLKNGTYSYVFREASVVELTFHTPVKVLNQVAPFKEFIFIGNRDLRCVAVMPFSVPKEKRSLAAEYLTRVNWYLQNGWFSLDYTDGEVRANAERSLVNSLPTKEDFDVLVMTPSTLISHYMSGLILTVNECSTPEENAERFTPKELR